MCVGRRRRTASRIADRPPSLSRGCLSHAERRLAYDSLPLYESLVTDLLAGAGPRRGDWIDRLRAYAAGVAALMAPLAVEGEDEEDEEAVDELALERAAWDWTALLFAGGGRADGAAAADLAHWLASHEAVLVTGDTLAAEAGRLATLPAPESDPSYWPTVARAAALGATAAAVDLLGAHSAWHDALAGGAGDERVSAALAALEPVGLLLRRAPRLARAPARGARATAVSAPDAHQSLPEFMDARKAWLGAARALAANGELWGRAAAGDPATAAGSRSTLAVLCGEPAALADAACHGWPELLVARALHGGGAGPRGPAEVAHAAARAAADGAAGASADPASPARDALLLGVADAAARGEPAGAAAALSAACGGWLLAHAAPLLGGPARGEPLPHAGMGAAEWHALDYAAALAGAPATRGAAARVLALCPAAGRPVAAALAARAPGAVTAALAGDDGPVDDMVAACSSIGLAGAAAGAARSAAAAAAAGGRLGAALAWCARAGDADRAGLISDMLLDAVRGSGDGGALAALEDVAPSLAALAGAPRATLPPRRGGVPALVALLELERAVAAASAPGATPAARGRAAAAAAAARACPSSMAPGLLFRVIPALEAGGAGEGDVDAMLAALADAVAEGEQRADRDAPAPAAEDVCTGAVRLALGRALARTFVEAA